MKFVKLLTLMALSAIAAPSALLAQDEAPLIPVGSLSAYPTIVQAGTHPQLTWDITLPESVTDIIEVIPPGTIVPKRNVIMDVRILGAGVTSYNSYYNTLTFVPTETKMSHNGGSYERVFYGNNYAVNPNEIVATLTLEEGDTVNFGSRYYWQNRWGPWYSSTNSSGNVVALVNGDVPPTTTPMHQAPTIEEFIQPYLDDNGLISIGPRDVIYLFELTHTNTNHSGFDLQDMAVLVSFYDEVAEDADIVDPGADAGAGGHTNNGHGNNVDGVDSSNPGNSKAGQDSDPNYDDEKGRGRRKK